MYDLVYLVLISQIVVYVRYW